MPEMKVEETSPVQKCSTHVFNIPANRNSVHNCSLEQNLWKLKQLISDSVTMSLGERESLSRTMLQLR